MNRVVVKIAYLGEGYCGSQIQPGSRTVEGDVLEDLVLITKCTPEELDLKFSSRTDKGVNSLGNAISFNSIFTDDLTLLKALNAVGGDVFYRSVCKVPDDFNVRYATGRTYRYVLPSDGMDMDLARQCSQLFLGEHDFLKFCKPDNKPTVTNIRRLDITEKDGLAILEFEARFFLWNMIRRIVSAIEWVSKGKASLDDVRAALDGKDMSFGMARPDALTLIDVEYDWLDFEPAEPSMFSDRLKEESFRDGLRRNFFGSL